MILLDLVDAMAMAIFFLPVNLARTGQENLAFR